MIRGKLKLDLSQNGIPMVFFDYMGHNINMHLSERVQENQDREVLSQHFRRLAPALTIP